MYKYFARRIKSEENARIINQIAEDELRHYNGWKEYTREEVQPRWLVVWFYNIIIAIFNYYISVAKGESFREQFVEMAGLSRGVAAFNFLIGYFIRIWLYVEV